MNSNFNKQYNRQFNGWSNTISEQFNYMGGQRQKNKINAPTFAYMTLYGKPPTQPIYGRDISHSTKMMGNIEVDEHFDESIISALNKIKNIEIRSTCEGHGANRPTYLIFRPLDQSIENVEKIVNKLNQYKTIKANYDSGQQNKYRIIVTTKNWYRPNFNNTNWEKWWSDLPSILDSVVNK
jgi:hypothetical protein